MPEEKEVTEVTEVTEEYLEDLRGEPRKEEEYFITIQKEKVRLYPSSLRNLPKLYQLLKDLKLMDTEADELDILSKEKIDFVAQIILLSLSEEDAEKYDKEVILDECKLVDFPIAIKAALGMNDFFAQMAQITTMRV